MRIVRGTRRGGSLDVPLAIAMGIAVVVPLAGSMVVPLTAAGTVGVPLAAGTVGVPLALDRTLVVPLAGALIGRTPVPGR
ncbi:hypothetical protein ABT075_42995 [Streptomyces sp. NPDC002677]|uniref:hypothetical protein n=1 Tax=Streptomyces sp. NPDC002677 TaxID=3154774 RepID=UPI0033169A5E